MGATRYALLARFRFAAAAAVLLGSSVGVLPFAPSASAAGNPSADIDQCGNGGVGDPDEACTGANWVNGNLGASKAHYNEGESVPYRIKFDNLSTAGSHTVEIEWDTTKGGKHALDYLTSYNRTENVGNDPCDGVAGCTLASATTFPIPADPAIPAEVHWQPGATQVPGVFTMFGGTITGVSAYTQSGSMAGDGSAKITLTFTAGVANPVLAWGGHIASRADWGRTNSAVAISGSPYHMRVLGLDGVGGNQDRSLSEEAVIFPGSITVTKEAAPESSASFGFTSTGGQLPLSFSLVDDGTASATRAVTGITVFGTSTVTELAAPGWTLIGLSCTDPTGGTTVDPATRTATIGMEEGDDVACTFRNTRNATISVVKTATPTSVPEPGGNVTFAVAVTNESTVTAVTITSLSDSIYGNITAAGGQVLSENCTVPQLIAAGATYNCSFTGNVSGNAGDSETDVVTASGTDALGNPVSDSDDAVVTITDVLPGIAVDKAATPSTLAEPGGPVLFTVTVTNPASAVEAITLTSLVDNVYGDLDGEGTCAATGQSIAIGATYTCSFTKTVTGNAGFVHTDTVTGTASDNDGNNVSDHDDATVTITDVLPSVEVTKTPNVSTRPEPGGPVTFTVTVTNPASAVEAIFLDTLVDTVYGDLDGEGTCAATGQSIAIGATYTCSFTKTVTGNAGFVHTNTVTGTASDNDGNNVSDHDDATVTITDVLPAIVVDKDAAPSTVAEPGGRVSFSVTVTNPENAVEAIFLDTLVDSVYGDLDGKGTCEADGQSIQPGSSYRCSFTRTVSGNAGFVHTNVVTATGSDDDGNNVSDNDDATVTVTDVAPAVVVDKAAAPSSVPEPGGTVTFTVTVTNPETAIEALSLTSLVDSVYGDLDGVGDCLADGREIAIGGSYSCSFTKTVSGNAGFTHTNVVTGTARDDEGNEVSDTDDATVTVTDVKPVILVDKTAGATSVPAGTNVTYTYKVTNPGVEPLLKVVVVDDKCSPVSFSGGDADGDSRLDTSEAWTFSCTSNLTSTTTNVAVATGEDDEGNKASSTDSATVEVVPVEVLGETLEAPVPVVAGDTLPVTGSQALALARAGTLLITVGGLLVLLARRRRQPLEA